LVCYFRIGAAFKNLIHFESCLGGGGVEYAIKLEIYLIKQVRSKNAGLVQTLGGCVRPRPNMSGMGPDKPDKTGRLQWKSRSDLKTMSLGLDKLTTSKQDTREQVDIR
jgi:hypothetical protein